MKSELSDHDDVKNCHNCGAAVSARYCPMCGQETRLHVASAAEFIHEFVGHYVALEGRLWQSLKYLLTRPGFLTAEYIRGRRVRYVEPLRLYLTFSLLFFALFKYGGYEVVAIDPPAAQGQVQQQTMSDEDKSFSATVAGINPVWARNMEKVLSKPSHEQARIISTAFFSYAPYAIFCLMPLFALYLKLLYLGSGKRYGEHLLFALHANAFAFIMLGVAMAVPWGVAQFVAVLWMAAYLPLAMRRVYGGGKLLTLLRWVVLVALHLLSMAVAIVSAVGLAVLA